MRNVVPDTAGSPSRLLVAKTKLSVDVEAPCVDVSIFGKRCSVAVSSGTALHLLLLVCIFIYNFDRLRSSHFSMFADTKLAHFGLTPSVELAIISDCKREEGTSFNTNDLLTVE